MKIIIALAVVLLAAAALAVIFIVMMFAKSASQFDEYTAETHHEYDLREYPEDEDNVIFNR